jgi:hypothetical protein
MRLALASRERAELPRQFNVICPVQTSVVITRMRVIQYSRDVSDGNREAAAYWIPRMRGV